MTAAAVAIRAARDAGYRVRLKANGRIGCEPAPSPELAAALSEVRDDVIAALAAEAVAARSYNPEVDSVHVEFTRQDGTTAAVWLVPDRYQARTVEGEPCIRRADVGAIAARGEGALLRACEVLLRIPGAVAMADESEAGRPTPAPGGGALWA